MNTPQQSSVPAPPPKKVKGVIEVEDGRRTEDTLRVWERYRELGHFWRLIALIQIPVVFISLVAMLWLYFTADTIVDVPERPQPGHYSVKLLPDSEFINVANEVVNLSSTYTPATAERQFKTTRKLLWEPALSQFENEKIKGEVPQIVETARSQIFVVDQNQVRVERRPDRDFVIVRLPGERRKIIGSKMLMPEQMIVYVRLTTIPKNKFNEFGIVATDIRFVDSEFQSYQPAPETPPVEAKPLDVAPVDAQKPQENQEPTPVMEQEGQVSGPENG